MCLELILKERNTTKSRKRIWRQGNNNNNNNNNNNKHDVVTTLGRFNCCYPRNARDMIRSFLPILLKFYEYVIYILIIIYNIHKMYISIYNMYKAYIVGIQGGSNGYPRSMF